MDWKKFLRDLGFDGSSPNLPTTNELKKQWKKRVRETHPDTGGDPNEFKKVMHAYKMLTDSSYVIEQLHNKGPDPSEQPLIVNHVVSFERAFFGGPQFISWTRMEMTESHKIVVSRDELKEIVALEFTLAPGTRNGYTEMFHGKGHKYSDRFGDARLIVHVQPHQKFQYGKEKEVISTEQVPLDQMLRGLEVEVPTLYGLRTVKLKPGTKPGQTYTIPKCGVNQEGDHLVSFQPLFPSEADLKGDSWNGLKIEWEVPPLSERDEEYLREAEELFRNMFGSIGDPDNPK